jgi:phosphotransferase system HPr (HPr) family protein
MVKAGAPLIDFDADFIATHAKSLLSMIIVTNPESVSAFNRSSGNVIAGEDVVLELELAPPALEVAEPPGAGKPFTSKAILIPNSAGLHARPASVLASLAKKYSSAIWLQRGDSKANAKSITGLMNLDVRHNDEVNLIARGRTQRTPSRRCCHRSWLASVRRRPRRRRGPAASSTRAPSLSPLDARVIPICSRASRRHRGSRQGRCFRCGFRISMSQSQGRSRRPKNAR